MISGFITTVASMPVDIAKTRIQNMKIIDGKPEYRGTLVRGDEGEWYGMGVTCDGDAVWVWMWACGGWVCQSKTLALIVR